MQPGRHACGLVRPSGRDGLGPKSVKKLKEPSFAASMQPVAEELALRTASTAAVDT
jgi:hypothetical protein